MNTFLSMSSFIFPLITFPYISRILLPEGTGKVNFAISFVSYFTMFAQLGIPTYGIRVCAMVRDDREKLTKVTQELLLITHGPYTPVVTYCLKEHGVRTLPVCLSGIMDISLEQVEQRLLKSDGIKAAQQVLKGYIAVRGHEEYISCLLIDHTGETLALIIDISCNRESGE